MPFIPVLNAKGEPVIGFSSRTAALHWVSKHSKTAQPSKRADDKQHRKDAYRSSYFAERFVPPQYLHRSERLRSPLGIIEQVVIEDDGRGRYHIAKRRAVTTEGHA